MRDPRARDDSGLGLIEIVIDMLLFGLLLAALAPMLITSLRASSTMSTRVSATQLVAEQMERVRTVTATCTDLTNYAALTSTSDSSLASRTDPRGRVVVPHRELTGTCTTGGTVKFRSWVTLQSDPTKVVAEATTLVWVTG
jgi:Tfp pilus assembly protein PilV